MAALSALLAAAPASADPLVVNRATGLALSGYDPVAYFTDHAPQPGRADLEMSHDGAVWRFRNTGNRDAFRDHPETYTPRFGGYDPVAITRNRSVEGNPQFWAIAGDRLYLFYSDADRAAFVAAPGRVLEVAERNWPEVLRTIGR
ncbi:MAG: YHS domain-containing (seleno)protein [Pseudolabrys sp.]